MQITQLRNGIDNTSNNNNYTKTKSQITQLNKKGPLTKASKQKFGITFANIENFKVDNITTF